MVKDFIIDFETFDNKPTAMAIDLAVLVFENNPENPPNFKDLVKQGRRWKLDLRSQAETRSRSPSTINWWKQQSDEAKQNLVPTDKDVTVKVAITEFLEYLKEQGIDPWKSQAWCRGQSFDFPILVNMLQEVYKTNDTDEVEPVKFWNQRDVRTAVEALMMSRGMCTVPLEKGTLDGFVAHDSVHDCAKDVMMLIYAQRYAMGLSDVPLIEDADPNSIKTR